MLFQSIQKYLPSIRQDLGRTRVSLCRVNRAYSTTVSKCVGWAFISVNILNQNDGGIVHLSVSITIISGW